MYTLKNKTYLVLLSAPRFIIIIIIIFTQVDNTLYDDYPFCKCCLFV